MRGWHRHHLIEWGFVGALLGLCIVLTTLQSRWTRNLGRATAQQQFDQIRGQAQLFCRAFDTEINEACAQLRPPGGQIEALGRATAHAQALRAWQAGNPRPIFRRLAVAVPEGKAAALYILDLKTAKLTPTEWPREWISLQKNLSAHVAGNPAAPFVDPTGFLREYPVFGGGDGDSNRPSEIEWFIAELDPDYVRREWLPDLVRTYLRSGKGLLNEIVVKTRPPSSELIFSTVGERFLVPENAISLGFNSKPRGGQVEEEEEGDEFWALFAWPRPGVFAAAISHARSRDFSIALVLDFGVFAGGLLVIHYARRARRLGDARMQFVTAVSHELRTPLTVIRAAGQNLRRGIVRDPKRIEKYADLIIEHSDRLNDMVEQVLAFAGARRNGFHLVRQPLELANVVRQAAEMCAIEARAAGCEMHVNVEESLPSVLGDANALRQVFQNLLVNSIKHGGKGKWIGVHTRYINGNSPGHVEVTVTDHGEGIPASEQPHVFEPFFRGSRARGQQARGSGIGLSVVQEIVKVHRGSVRLESKPGEGTTFVVNLPALDGAKSPSAG